MGASTRARCVSLLLLAVAPAAAAPAVPPAPPPTGGVAQPAPRAGETAPAEPPRQPQRDYDAPPPAAGPADRALWETAYALNVDLVVEQYTAARLTHQAKGGKYDQRLPELVKAGTLSQARAEALTQELAQRWTGNVVLIQSQWPVSKVRVCQYELLNFEGVLYSEERPKRQAQLEDARGDLTECVSRGTTVLRAVRASNEALAAAIEAIDRALAVPAAPTSSGAAPGAGAPAAGPVPVRAGDGDRPD